MTINTDVKHKIIDLIAMSLSPKFVSLTKHATDCLTNH